MGRSNTEIAQELYIGIATVKTHINKILKKTGATSRSDLIKMAKDSQ